MTVERSNAIDIKIYFLTYFIKMNAATLEDSKRAAHSSIVWDKSTKPGFAENGKYFYKRKSLFGSGGG